MFPTFPILLVPLPTTSQQSQAKESSQGPQMDVGGEEGVGGGVGGGGGGDGERAAHYERDLVHKSKLLRHELSLQQPQAGHCRIEVSREEIFEVGAGGREGNHNVTNTDISVRHTWSELMVVRVHVRADAVKVYIHTGVFIL